MRVIRKILMRGAPLKIVRAAFHNFAMRAIVTAASAIMALELTKNISIQNNSVTTK